MPPVGKDLEEEADGMGGLARQAWWKMGMEPAAMGAAGRSRQTS